MKKTRTSKFAFVGWISIYLASCFAFNQKAIVHTKEKIQLSIEDIVDRDMLDNSSPLRRTYNKTAGFNGKTYKKKIKYYIHDENTTVNLEFENFTISYAYEISDDVERFIVDTFNSIDAYIDLDFERVYSPNKANITIYKTYKFHDDYEGYSELQWVDDEKIYSQIVWSGFKDAHKQKLKNYPTLSSDYATLLLHEITHSLGLMHSGCEQEWCKYNFDPKDSRFDVKDTIMSYNFVPDAYIFLSDLDISALQKIWGVEKDTTTGLMLYVPEKLHAENSIFYKDRGYAKSKKGDHHGAISDYNKAIEINPNDAKAFYNRGWNKGNLKDHDGAISDYTKAIEINPQYAKAFFSRGWNKAELKDYYGAISDYNKAIEINPQYAWAYNNRGIAKRKIGDDKGGCDDYKKAILFGNKTTEEWFKTDGASWCRNM